MSSSRRKWFWLVAAAAAVLVIGLLAADRFRSAHRTSAVEQRRLELAGGLAPSELNVIVITIDTLRSDRLSCYGAQRVKTPAIDKLAAEGVLFANAASTVPFTLPAHSSLMTGTYPPYHGVRENVGYFLDEDIPTLAEQLKAGGWNTSGFVSAFVLDSRWGIGRGFETYFDDFDLGEMDSPNLGSVQRDGRETLTEAVRWLDERPEGKFFLWLHLFDPHDPYTPPEPFASQYPGRPYDAEVAYADSLVGEFQEVLKERNLLDSSLMILTADHGEGLGQHREKFHGFFIYDSTIHVPLIVRFPGGQLAGRVVDEAVSHVDLLPTILQATEQAIPETVQGISLLPLLTDSGETPERFVYSESLYPLLHYGWAPLRSLRGNSHKFIDAPQPELYAIGQDPEENDNVVAIEPRLSQQMKDELAGLLETVSTGVTGTARQPELDEETMAQLEALGYLAGRGGVDIEQESDIARADPKDRIGLHQLVMSAQSEMGRNEEASAAEKLRQVLETDPSVIEAHQMLGTMANRQHRSDEAVRHFQAALALEPEHSESLFGLAVAYRETGRADEALVGFRRLLELNPSDTRAAVTVVDILVAKDEIAEAITILEAAAVQRDDLAGLQNQLGELHAMADRREEAKSSFARSIELGDKLAPPRFNMAALLEDEGLFDEAIVLYEEVIVLAPKHYKAQFNLGRIYGHLGEIERHQQLWEAAVASNPDFIQGHYLLAKLIMDRGGDLAESEKITRQTLAQDTEHRAGPLGYFLLADILNRQGRSREAQQALATAQQIQAEGS